MQGGGAVSLSPRDCLDRLRGLRRPSESFDYEFAGSRPCCKVRRDGGQQLGLSRGRLNLINAHVGDARLPESERYGGLRRNVYHSATDERSPANDRDHRATAVVEVDDPDMRPHRQAAMRRKQSGRDASIGNTRPTPVLPPKPNQLTRKAPRTKRRHFAPAQPSTSASAPCPCLSMSRRPASCNTDSVPRRANLRMARSGQWGVPAESRNGRPAGDTGFGGASPTLRGPSPHGRSRSANTRR